MKTSANPIGILAGNSSHGHLKLIYHEFLQNFGEISNVYRIPLIRILIIILIRVADDFVQKYPSWLLWCSLVDYFCLGGMSKVWIS